MSEAKKRKFHAPEFKAKVALEALRGVKTINEIGQEYGVHRLLQSDIGRRKFKNRQKSFLKESEDLSLSQ